MRARLTLRAAARAEIAEAYRWYEDRRSGLGEEFLSALRDVLSAIEENPLRFAVIRQDVRRALLTSFPYSVLFLAEGERAIVLACFHASRDPRRWQDRR